MDTNITKQFRDPSLVKYEYFVDDDLLDNSFLELRRNLLKKCFLSKVKVKETNKHKGMTYEFFA